MSKNFTEDYAGERLSYSARKKKKEITMKTKFLGLAIGLIAMLCSVSMQHAVIIGKAPFGDSILASIIMFMGFPLVTWSLYRIVKKKQ